LYSHTDEFIILHKFNISLPGIGFVALLETFGCGFAYNIYGSIKATRLVAASFGFLAAIACL
jgi:hypothetical protein